jgi:hypothetical protein
MRYIPVAFFVLLAAVGLAVLGLRSAKATTVSPATNWTIHIDAVDRQRDARVPNLLERRWERAARGD